MSPAVTQRRAGVRCVVPERTAGSPVHLYPAPAGLCSVSALRSHSGVLLLVSCRKHFLSTCDFLLGGRSRTRLFIIERGSWVRAVAPASRALTAGIVACAQSTGRWPRCCCQGNLWMHSGADIFRLAVLMSDPLVMLSALRVAVCEKSASYFLCSPTFTDVK